MESKLKHAKNIHPVLQHLVEIHGSEVNLDLLLNPEYFRVGLNLVTELTGEKLHKGYTQHSTRVRDTSSGMIVPRVLDVPVHAEEYRCKVEFGYATKNDPKLLQIVMATDLAGVQEIKPGLAELDDIAKDLHTVYGYSYQPILYHNGKLHLRNGGPKK